MPVTRSRRAASTDARELARADAQAESTDMSELSEEDDTCTTCGKTPKDPKTYNGSIWCGDCVRYELEAQRREEGRRGMNNKVKCCGVIASVVVVVAIFMYSFPDHIPDFRSWMQKADENLDCSNETMVKERIVSIRKSFYSQEKDTWNNFLSGINSVFMTDPTEPTSFLLLYEKSKGDGTTNQLAERISDLAASCMAHDSSQLSGEIIKTSGSELEEKFGGDTGELIHQFKPKLNESGVMYIKDFHKIPAKLAKEFHYFCDAYQPLVSKAIFLFTMPVDRFTEGSSIEDAEAQLRQVFGGHLERFVLDPFITRITGNVIRVLD